MGKKIAKTNEERREAMAKAEAMREKREKEASRRELEILREQVRLEREERRKQVMCSKNNYAYILICIIVRG